MSDISRRMYEEMMEKIVDTGDVCPLCGGVVLAYNDPSDDPTMSEWCSNDDCDWHQNQFMSYEDFTGGCDHE